MQISRSVIIPMTLRSSVTTGTAPQSPSHINLATTARSVSGETVFTLDVCKSLTVMFGSFFPIAVQRKTKGFSDAPNVPSAGTRRSRVKGGRPRSATPLFGSRWPYFGDQIEVTFEDEFCAAGAPPVLEVTNDGR